MVYVQLLAHVMRHVSPHRFSCGTSSHNQLRFPARRDPVRTQMGTYCNSLAILVHGGNTCETVDTLK
jgi:hypothetical protein